MFYYKPTTEEIRHTDALRGMKLPYKDPEALLELGWYPLEFDRSSIGEYDKIANDVVPATPTKVQGEDKYVVAYMVTPVREEERQTRFDGAKGDLLLKLNNAFMNAEQNGVITSSAGFDIDANDRANRDLDGLATSMETAGTQTVMFCAADNTFHEVTLAQVKTMRLELIAHAQALYARKWQLRAAIEAATTTEELEAITIDFSDVDSVAEGAE